LAIYYALEDPSVTVKTAIPSTKVSPLYLQQQFFQYVKQQLAQINTIRRSPSPTSIIGQKPVSTNRTTTTQNRPTQRVAPPSAPSSATAAARIPQHSDVPEASIDFFDSFDDYEAAFYRLNVLKPLLSRLFESPTTIKKTKNSNILEEIEADLISATKKKISSLQERTEAFQKNHQETIKQIKNDSQIFWSIFGELESAEEIDLLDQIYKKLIDVEMKDMEQDDFVPLYTCL
jgi:hypothetical protein